MIEYSKLLGGFFGLCVGDALGVPYEFTSRELMKKNPAKDMIGFGSHFQPAGTWSDDSSLTFCTADSLCNGLSYEDIAKKFVSWLYEGLWTPHGKVFDVGKTTKEAIDRIKKGVNPLSAGGTNEFNNGNGSLMRMLPLVFFLFNHIELEQYKITHNISAITLISKKLRSHFII